MEDVEGCSDVVSFYVATLRVSAQPLQIPLQILGVGILYKLLSMLNLVLLLLVILHLDQK